MCEGFNTQREKKHYKKINSFDYIRNKNFDTSFLKSLKEKCKQQTVKKGCSKTDKYIMHLLHKKIIQFGKKNSKKSINK